MILAKLMADNGDAVAWKKRPVDPIHMWYDTYDKCNDRSRSNSHVLAESQHLRKQGKLHRETFFSEKSVHLSLKVERKEDKCKIAGSWSRSNYVTQPTCEHVPSPERGKWKGKRKGRDPIMSGNAHVPSPESQFRCHWSRSWNARRSKSAATIIESRKWEGRNAMTCDIELIRLHPFSKQLSRRSVNE